MTIAEAQRGWRSLHVYRLMFAPLFLLPSVELVAQSLITSLPIKQHLDAPDTEAEAKNQRLLLGETWLGSEGREETKGEILGESLPQPDPVAALRCKSHPPPRLSCPKARELGFPSPHWLVTGHRLPWEEEQGRLSPGRESTPGAPVGDLERTAAVTVGGEHRGTLTVFGGCWEGTNSGLYNTRPPAFLQGPITHAPPTNLSPAILFGCSLRRESCLP